MSGAVTPSGAQRRHTHDRHLMHRAGMGEDRATGAGVQRQIGQTDHHIPTAAQQHPPGRRHDVGVAGRCRNEPILFYLDPPLRPGQPLLKNGLQTISERPLGHLNRPPRGSDYTEHHARRGERLPCWAHHTHLRIACRAPPRRL